MRTSKPKESTKEIKRRNVLSSHTNLLSFIGLLSIYYLYIKSIM